MTHSRDKRFMPAGMCAALVLGGVIFVVSGTVGAGGEAERHGHGVDGEATVFPGKDAPDPYIVDQGSLPGITWADDIHPI